MGSPRQTSRYGVADPQTWDQTPAPDHVSGQDPPVRGGLSRGAVLQWAPTTSKPLSKPLLPRPLPRPLPTSSSHLLRKCSTTSWGVQPTLGLLVTLPELF